MLDGALNGGGKGGGGGQTGTYAQYYYINIVRSVGKRTKGSTTTDLPNAGHPNFFNYFDDPIS